MKIVIAGAGEVGSHLAKMLSSNQANIITVIDGDPERLANVAENYDVLTVNGNPTSITMLKEAGAVNADLFIAVCPAAEQDINIVSAIIAKKLGAKKVIARVNNEEYLKPSSRILFTDMGIDLIFHPERVAADEIWEMLKQTASNEFMEFANGKLQMIVFRLEDGSPIIGKRMSDFNLGNDDLPYRLVAISRKSETIIPDNETKLKINDTLYVITKKESAESVLEYTGKRNVKVHKLLILGGGRIGEAVAAKAIEAGIPDIKIIERKKDKCTELSEKFSKALVVNGDGRNSNFLIEEGIKDCEAFVAVTSNTETNILACVIAKRFGVPKTIAEVENIEYIKLAEGMGVDAVINKKLITAARIFRFTLSSRVKSIRYLSGTNAEIIEYYVKAESRITSGPLKDLKFPEHAVIGGVIRKGQSLIPVGSTRIMAYDKVVIFALPHAVEQVDRFFE